MPSDRLARMVEAMRSVHRTTLEQAWRDALDKEGVIGLFVYYENGEMMLLPLTKTDLYKEPDDGNDPAA